MTFRNRKVSGTRGTLLAVAVVPTRSICRFTFKLRARHAPTGCSRRLVLVPSRDAVSGRFRPRKSQELHIQEESTEAAPQVEKSEPRVPVPHQAAAKS